MNLITEIKKLSIQHGGMSKLTKDDYLGRLQFTVSVFKNILSMNHSKLNKNSTFQIGCNKKLFESAESIASQLPEQMRENSINEISGFDFGFWAIWNEESGNRRKRDATELGDGSGEYYDDDDDE